ncbi:MAG: hypothetical protein K2X55_28460, partial [Burkholderiaceae bacterium]|nr:hypothetical protein [Burkholderiaceae bacterium]
MLRVQGSLDDALKDPALSIAIRRVARKPMFRAAPAGANHSPARPLPKGGDFKRFAANDRE